MSNTEACREKVILFLQESIIVGYMILGLPLSLSFDFHFVDICGMHGIAGLIHV